MQNLQIWMVLIGLLCSFSGLRSQDLVDSLEVVLTIPGGSMVAASDKLGQVFVARPDHSIEKYSATGELLSRYTQNRFGRPAAIDAGNPMQVLIWYADSRTVVWLNRSLTEIGFIQLIEAGYPEVKCVAQALDGGLWLYDDWQFKLRKISPQGRQVFESQALNLLFRAPLEVRQIEEAETGVYVLDSKQGLLQFDPYGQFQKQTLLPDAPVQFHISGRELLWLDGDGHIRVTSLASWPIPEQVWPTPPDGSWTVSAGYLLCRYDDRLVALRRPKVE